MTKKIIWLSALALALLIGQPSIACSVKNQSKQCHCGENKELSNVLHLTEEQKLKIKAIRIQAHKNLKANYQQLKALRGQMNALVTAEKMDEAKLDSLISQRSKIKADILKSHLLVQNQIYNLLTDKQKIQYQEMKKKHDVKKG